MAANEEQTSAAPIWEGGPVNGRDARGRFGPGNDAALKHGVFAEVRFRGARPIVDAMVAAIRTELGSTVTTILGDLIVDYARTSLVADLLFEQLARAGARRRGALIERYNAVMDRKVRLASLIGIERGAAKPASLEDFVRG